ncbi:hypothetical protein C8T65DRAFT_758039 [Cerioporus squamosus]|nr:hypothetical protein C8T65DRAFT_758039 [Cerioporus squamosus]
MQRDNIFTPRTVQGASSSTLTSALSSSSLASPFDDSDLQDAAAYRHGPASLQDPPVYAGMNMHHMLQQMYFGNGAGMMLPSAASYHLASQQPSTSSMPSRGTPATPANMQELYVFVAAGFREMNDRCDRIMSFVQESLPIQAGRRTAPSGQSTAIFEKDEKGFLIDIPRKQEDFPNMPYWTEDQWKAAPPPPTAPDEVGPQRGPTAMSKNINKNMRYITDEDGKPIDGLRAKALRRGLYKFCLYLERIGEVPDTWVHGLDGGRELEYIAWMRSQFKECQRCDDNYIAKKIAKTYFLQWRRKRRARLTRLANQAAHPQAHGKVGKKRQRNHETHADDTENIKKDNDIDTDDDMFADDGGPDIGDLLGHNVLNQAPYTIAPASEPTISGVASNSSPPDEPPTKRARVDNTAHSASSSPGSHLMPSASTLAATVPLLSPGLLTLATPHSSGSNFSQLNGVPPLSQATTMSLIPSSSTASSSPLSTLSTLASMVSPLPSSASAAAPTASDASPAASAASASSSAAPATDASACTASTPSIASACHAAPTAAIAANSSSAADMSSDSADSALSSTTASSLLSTTLPSTLPSLLPSALSSSSLLSSALPPSAAPSSSQLSPLDARPLGHAQPGLQAILQTCRAELFSDAPDLPAALRNAIPAPTAMPAHKAETVASKPKAASKKALVWPPPESSTKTRDVCARLWHTKHGGSAEMFDVWYKYLASKPHYRTKYVSKAGVVSDEIYSKVSRKASSMGAQWIASEKARSSGSGCREGHRAQEREQEGSASRTGSAGGRWGGCAREGAPGRLRAAPDRPGHPRFSLGLNPQRYNARDSRSEDEASARFSDSACLPLVLLRFWPQPEAADGQEPGPQDVSQLTPDQAGPSQKTSASPPPAVGPEWPTAGLLPVEN